MVLFVYTRVSVSIIFLVYLYTILVDYLGNLSYNLILSSMNLKKVECLYNYKSCLFII